MKPELCAQLPDLRLVRGSAFTCLTGRHRPGRRPATPPGPPALDSFIAVHPDGDVTLATSHIDCGTGIRTAYLQIAAEELALPSRRFHFVEGDTAATPNHGGTGGSSGVPGEEPTSETAATARQALLELGAKQLDCAASTLTIRGGEVIPSSGGKGVSVATLVGGKQFHLKVDDKAVLKVPPPTPSLANSICVATFALNRRNSTPTCRTIPWPECCTRASSALPVWVPSCFPWTKVRSRPFPAHA